MESESSRLKAVINAAPFGAHYWGLGPDNTLVFEGANVQAERMLGIQHAPLVGKRIEDAFPALNGTDIPDSYRRIARDGGSFERESVEYKDGKIVGCFEISASQTSDNHMVVFFRDITERKRNEMTLANEKERLLVTLRSIGDGVIVTDARGRITLMNTISEKLTGWIQEDAYGRALPEVFKIINEKTRKICENPVEKVLKTGQIVGLANHTALIARDGTERVIADSGSPIRDSQGTILGVVLVFRDITEQTRMEDALANAQRLESLGVLAGGIAHDFNNLLSGVFGFMSLAKNVLDRNDVERAKEHLTRALTVYERAKGLTQQLLTFSKGGQPVKTLVSVDSVLLDAAHFALSGSSIRSEWDLPEGLPGTEADSAQLEQVFDNILMNAVQAMPMGGTVTIMGRLLSGSDLPSGLPSGRYIRVSISDQGVGMPPEHLSKIFEPFFTTKQSGSGLGLATAFSIMRRHDGTITVESVLGKGSTFHVYLPVSERQEASPIVFGTTFAGGGKVLVVDDEDFIRDIAQELLEEMGFQADCFADGETAVAAFKRAKEQGSGYRFGILDLTIPGGMGGKEAVLRIRELDTAVPLFASSGYSDDPIMAEPASFGFSGSLAKPYRREELVHLLSNYFASK